jgi:hypothetical protein
MAKKNPSDQNLIQKYLELKQVRYTRATI